MRSVADRGPAIKLRTLALVAVAAVVAMIGAAVVPDILATDPALPSRVSATPPQAFTITYHVTAGDATTTEVLAVRRPFASRLVVHEGDSTKGQVLSQRASDLGVLATTSGTQWGRLVVPPALASGDLRPDAVLASAVGSKVLRDLGPSSVAGRACRTYVAATTVSAGTLEAPGNDERAEVCIDAAGLVLQERWTIDSKVVRTRRAVALRFDADDLTVPQGTALPGGGLLNKLADDAPIPFPVALSFGTFPTGFTHVGRYAVVPPDLSPTRGSDAPKTTKVATVTDVWARGADVLILDQGAASGVDPFVTSSIAAPVDLPGFASSRLVLDLRATEIRIRLDDGGFVRVAGTLPPEELVALARTLEAKGAAK